MNDTNTKLDLAGLRPGGPGKIAHEIAGPLVRRPFPPSAGVRMPPPPPRPPQVASALAQPSPGAQLIAAERARQVQVEGWSSSHDDDHVGAELSKAAEAYLVAAWAQIKMLDWSWLCYEAARRWPWGVNAMPELKHDPVRNLVKAGALIAAEIDRLKRAEAKQS